jgi:hypothetical protein
MRMAWLLAAAAAVGFAEVPENLYQGELVSFPGAWAFQIHRPHVILVTDEELEILATDPERELNMALGFEPRMTSLRKICEQAQAHGQRTLIVAFDHFFSQYRPGQEGKPRRLTPDMDEYIQHIAAIGKFAEGYGLGLELSLLSPLEIGPAYRNATGESGVWMHYRKGLRDPQTGAFSVQLWRQLRWSNNKGPVDLEDAGVRVFAFREHGIGGTPYRGVDPGAIREITDVAQVDVWPEERRAGDYRAQRIRVHGEGHIDLEGLNRVLVVQQYRTPELDYFSDQALPFLNGLVDKYADAGVRLNGLYSDEMHIQQDWGYFSHHDHGQFALRYVSPGLAARFASQYGEQYRDFAKYLVYFCYGQEDFANDLTATQGIMHTWGDSPQAIHEAALFRTRYYHLLQNGVVDLFVAAKRHAEERMGHKLESRAHATWAESPTIDKWEVGPDRLQRNQYEYTSNFVWSATVHQAASACYDYFKWGDFLTGNGNDHAEGGWLDRNYVGLMLACSTGIINEVPYSYGAHWGMPHEVHVRRTALQNAYGAGGSPLFGLVQDMEHRDVDVMMLYPLDLVSVEERFGSWMTQYGYANQITQAKLVELAEVRDGALAIGGRRFTTLATMFEPFPSEKLLDLMRAFAEHGGRLIWSGPPPLLTLEGGDARSRWSELFGVDYEPMRGNGWLVPGRQVTFDGLLKDVAPQTILTDLLPDRIYPVTPRGDVETVARVHRHIVGTHRALGNGTATYLGYRPRDDQSQSLGHDVRNWFEVLDALGAYPATGAFPNGNDNTEYLSRTGDVLACRFPNGAVAIAPHLRTYEENWPGGFSRKPEEDTTIMEAHPPPSDALTLNQFQVNGHTVTYSGRNALVFRVDDEKRLIAFTGENTNQITIDDAAVTFADAPLGQIAWGPVHPSRQVDGGAVMQIIVHGAGTIRIPAPNVPASFELVAQGATPGSRGHTIPATLEDGMLEFNADSARGRWLFVVPAP